ncbi:putative xylogalacturonan beta-1,3-xylosyltransferase [Medicago truncatula]|uniref:Exostosin family protein n=1 Tax=Medicago truncatula TaxID=3880 RepID=A0A072UDU4_MEDTR|nr:exostosin family protein [Medicago truncatula]RHN55758.1 putative xylogalacturonan beta-1,3-xylosyltransferase [Medicago truncatula]
MKQLKKFPLTSKASSSSHHITDPSESSSSSSSSSSSLLMMSSVKQNQQQSSFHTLFSLRGSLLTLAILTHLSFTYLSLKYSTPSSQVSVSVANLVDAVKNEDEVPVTVKVVDAGRNEEEDDGGDEFGDVYHSPRVFKLNFAEMEKKFKVYIYPDGDSKTFYQTPRKLTGKYASEGYFFQNIRESRFRTLDPDQAHLFFIPISCHKMRGKGTSYDNMTIIVQNYVESLISKYPYWNRTLGADHFFVTCHDVGVRATEGLPLLVKNSIRAVCSPSYDVGFIPHKDVALPQVLQPFALPAGGNDVENRTSLGFWAGHRNSKIRVILARVWENDTELDISNNRI